MNADALILHHYEGSPFAEKARLMLGFKGLAWRSVTIPVVMPKPDLVALTGGYRRTPVLQVGADVYCDTALIARVLERLQPAPSLFAAAAPLAPLLAQWADSTLFWVVIAYVMQPAALPHLFAGVPPEQMQAFAADRAPFSANVPKLRPADAQVQLVAALDRLEAQLAQHGGDWLFGPHASIADFSVGHCLWFLRRSGPLGRLLDARARLAAWHQRLLALGHGPSSPMPAAEALAIAAAAGGHAPAQVVPELAVAEAGAEVSVAAIDYGMDPVHGALVGIDADEVVVERRDERAGLLHVHFPRQGFRITKVRKETA